MPEPSLKDCRVLVVEDEYMLASELKDELDDAGAIVLGPVGTVEDALKLIQGEAEIDGAVVDVNLHGEMAYPVADLLLERAVPMVFTTGYDVGDLPPRFAHVVRCEKPVQLRRVAQAIGKALGT